MADNGVQVHDVDFRTSERDFDSFAGALTEHIIEKDFTIPELPVKDIVRVMRGMSQW